MMLVQTCAQSAARQQPPRHQVLIVDDDDTTTDVLQTRLSRQGFGTLVANSGGRALELAAQQQPDCILLDLNLPDLDGFEVCQRLVDAPITAEIPVIIISGLERPDVIRRSRAAGCQFYLRKPYDPNALLALIQRAIEGNDAGELDE